MFVIGTYDHFVNYFIMGLNFNIFIDKDLVVYLVQVGRCVYRVLLMVDLKMGDEDDKVKSEVGDYRRISFIVIKHVDYYKVQIIEDLQILKIINKKIKIGLKIYFIKISIPEIGLTNFI